MTSSFESTSFIWSCSYVHHVSHQTIWCPLSKAGHNHPLTQCSVFVRLCFCFDGYAYISSYMHNTNIFIHIAKSVSRQLKVPNCFAHQTPRQGAWTCSSSDYRKRSGACLGPQLETYETWKGAPKPCMSLLYDKTKQLWDHQNGRSFLSAQADQLVESLQLSARSRGLGGTCEERPRLWKGPEDQQQWVK